MKLDHTRLCQILGHEFQQFDLLNIALTHRSAGTPNNERLEFLGDALLSYVIAEALFERFTTASEGELTRLRASLVKKDTLVEIAQHLNVGTYLRLGSGELKTGGWRRTSILADAVEALLGAIYLDQGMDACKTVILQLWQTRLERLSPKKIEKDPKTRLQEYLQSKQQLLPTYQVLNVNGDPHEQHFEVECSIPILKSPTYGEGETRRRAEQAAAESALKLLKL